MLGGIRLDDVSTSPALSKDRSHQSGSEFFFAASRLAASIEKSWVVMEFARVGQHISVYLRAARKKAPSELVDIASQRGLKTNDPLGLPDRIFPTSPVRFELDGSVMRTQPWRDRASISDDPSRSGTQNEDPRRWIGRRIGHPPEFAAPPGRPAVDFTSSSRGRVSREADRVRAPDIVTSCPASPHRSERR
jgi:hypothetical protein